MNKKKPSNDDETKEHVSVAPESVKINYVSETINENDKSLKAMGDQYIVEHVNFNRWNNSLKF